ncbi:TolC family protein [Arcticibacter sp. MXS-1]|uniref:TolC family protein n=1 Tax=Arcticibacter sp. MXS-1 TaxID=3341726 RepID=UPI0035A9078B
MMYSIKTIIASAAIIAGSTSVQAQPVLSLSDVLKEVEKNSPSLKVFDARVNSQNAKIAGAGAWMAPMVGVGSFMTPYPGTEQMGEENKGALMISAEQDIPNPAKVSAKRRYLSAQAGVTMAEKAAFFNGLRARTKQLYLELIVSYRKRAVQKENLRIMQNMKKLAAIRYPYSQGSLSQVYKAEGREYESQNMILMTEGEIQSRTALLNALMYRDGGTPFVPDTTFKVAYRPIALADSSYFASSRSDILQMDKAISAMQLNIEQMRKEIKPDFKLKFDHMKSYSSMMPAQFTAMAMVSIPIVPWASSMYKAEEKSMKFEIEAMNQRREAMLTEMSGMARSMDAELRGMEDQIWNFEEKILPALSKNLRVSMLAYQENKLDLNMVIDAWEAQNMAQMNYLSQLQKFYQMIAAYEETIER